MSIFLFLALLINNFGSILQDQAVAPECDQLSMQSSRVKMISEAWLVREFEGVVIRNELWKAPGSQT
jgi:hypothetical protein